MDRKNGLGEYDYYIAGDTPENSMYGGSKCPGHPDTLSSYDCEAFGSLSLLTALTKVVSDRKRFPFTVILDNKAVWTEIQEIIHNKSLPHPLAPCYEV